MSTRRCQRCGWTVPVYVPMLLVAHALSDHRANTCTGNDAHTEARR
jgi:hypothetical protein